MATAQRPPWTPTTYPTTMLTGACDPRLCPPQKNTKKLQASWYRKHFYLPEAWRSDGGATLVHFEGVFHHATFFLNGAVASTSL